MKILLITFAYRPSLNPRAFRWSAVAEQWVKEGHEVEVLCEPGTADKETINGVRIYRAGRHRAPTVGGLAPANASWLRGFARLVWRAAYWPDYALGWYRPAMHRLRSLLASRDYDLVISSSLPFTGHLVGLAANTQLPGRPWIVDIGDPFSFAEGVPVNNVALFGRLNRRVERAILTKAHVISVTTAGTRDRYVQLFPFIATKTVVVPPLLSPAFSGQPTAPVVGPKRLVFLGTLYNDIRSPAPLLACFARLLEESGRDLELHFYGSDKGCEYHFDPYAPLMGKRIFRHGLVAQAIAAEAMRDAAVLVNIGNATAYQLPSKVVEYAASAKPILNFSPMTADSSKQFFSQFDGVLSVPITSWHNVETFDEIAAFVADLPNIDPEQRAAAMKPFHPAEIAAQYLNLLPRIDAPIDAF